KSPITLLELGLFARSGKLVVCCPVGFWRRGNIEVVCARYGIPLVDSLKALIDLVRRRLADDKDENPLDSERERPLADDLAHRLPPGGPPAGLHPGRGRGGTPGMAAGYHRLDVVTVGPAERRPGLAAVEARHAVDDQAHRRPLQRQVLE